MSLKKISKYHSMSWELRPLGIPWKFPVGQDLAVGSWRPPCSNIAGARAGGPGGLVVLGPGQGWGEPGQARTAAGDALRVPTKTIPAYETYQHDSQQCQTSPGNDRLSQPPNNKAEKKIRKIKPLKHLHHIQDNFLILLILLS